MKTPDGYEKWNRALRGAWRKGWEAGMAGEPESALPYLDKRKPSGRLSWSRAFQSAWLDGWRAGDEQRKDDAITAFYTEGSEYGRRPTTWVR